MYVSWLDSLEAQARAELPRPLFEYFSQGARDGTTAAAATGAWRRLTLVPRVLTGTAEPRMAGSLLGTPVDLPLGVAPSTLQRAADPDGEVAMARAVAAAGSLMVVSSNAGYRFAEIAATGVAWWLQAYLPQQRERARPLLDAAVGAGARAVVLTVDTPVVGTKYQTGASVWDEVDVDWLRVNLGDAADDPKAVDLGARDIAWLAEATGLPVVVKGVLHPDDACRCVDAGAAAVWVSNHGGRQLDRAASTASLLPAVVRAVGSDVEVYVDGGLRNGLDLLAATALGATAAFVGRQPLYALGVAGEPGVRRMFAEFGAELGESMHLAGAADLAAVRALDVLDEAGGAGADNCQNRPKLR